MSAKPCPFCGFRASVKPEDDTPDMFRVYCEDCGASGPHHGAPDFAEEAWNERPAESNYRDGLAALAMQSLIVKAPFMAVGHPEFEVAPEAISEGAYDYADAMIKRRSAV